MMPKLSLAFYLCALLFSPLAKAELAFSCADHYISALHKAVITGTILEGFEKHAFNVKAEIDTIQLFDDDKQILTDTDIDLHGEGFVSATGSHQFDLDSNRKVGKGFVSFQISLKNRSNLVYSYLTLNDVKYRTICAVAKPVRFTRR